ncbi:hypothetical protein JTB14_016293 [Gonioctena quinquepunctata]|nr:hypothetical protein JTB14_016293 [Gonioctena quinquepunctata]
MLYTKCPHTLTNLPSFKTSGVVGNSERSKDCAVLYIFSASKCTRVNFRPAHLAATYVLAAAAMYLLAVAATRYFSHSGSHISPGCGNHVYPGIGSDVQTGCGSHVHPGCGSHLTPDADDCC